MLPTEDAIWVGEELARRFGLRFWQFALTATDANRFAIRLARAVTGRPKILVFNWCYHGTVDETLATLDGRRGRRARRERRPAGRSRRDDARRRVQRRRRRSSAGSPHGDVACVLAEPALTNIGIVLPEPGFHDALRELTRRDGTLLVIDETHTICAGPGGYTGAHGLEPDLARRSASRSAAASRRPPTGSRRMSRDASRRRSPSDESGRRRHRRHARRQRALARRDAGDARARS